jgi:Transcriptional regulator PadR-like family/FtsX-like permease family
MGDKADVWQGTLALIILKTLDAMGALHGYGIARRIEQISGDILSVNYGTLYPALLKLEQEGYVASEWGVSDNHRRARSICSPSVVERTQEIGVRIALGASPSEVRRMVIRQGLRLVFLGLAVGGFASFVLARVFRSELYDVSTSDPFTYVTVATGLVLTGLLAC